MAHPQRHNSGALLRWLFCLSACLCLALWGTTLLTEHMLSPARPSSQLQTTSQNTTAQAPEIAQKQLKLLDWNLFMLPLPLGYAHDPACRAKSMTEFIQSQKPDIITLEESFNRLHLKHLSDTLKSSHPHQLMHLPDASGKRRTNGGISILSKYPIESSHAQAFKDCFGADCVNDKGFVHALVRVSANQRVNIIATHLQSLPTPQSQAVRLKQLAQIKTYADKNKDIQQWPTLIVGDLNVNGIRHTPFKLPPKADELSAYGEALKALGNSCVECKNDRCKQSCNAYPKDAMRELTGKWAFTPTATAKLNSANCVGPTLTQCVDFNQLKYWVGRMRLDYILEWAPPQGKRAATVTKAYFEAAPSQRCEGNYLSDHKALIAHIDLAP